MGDVWAATVKAIRNENYSRLRCVEGSLASLSNKTGEYADDHRKVAALRRELQGVIDRHIEQHGTILPAPPST